MMGSYLGWWFYFSVKTQRHSFMWG